MSGKLRECPECGTTNDVFVNPEKCYSCGHVWWRRFTFTGP